MANELDFVLLFFYAFREAEFRLFHSLLPQHTLKLHFHFSFKISAPLVLIFGEETDFKLIWTLLLLNHELEELVIFAVELPELRAVIDWLSIFQPGLVASVSVWTFPIRLRFA
jgi:hypothetical protein